MTALHTLSVLSHSFTCNASPIVSKEFPHMLNTCWLLFLHSAFQLIPIHLNWVEVGWLWRPGHLMQISISFLQIALTQPGGVLDHCPVEKQMIVPLSANQMGWRIAAECCGSHADCVPWILNKSQTVSPAKHLHTITPPPPCFMVGTTDVEIIRSPTPRLTKTRRLEPKISNLDQSTDFHRSVYCLCFLAQTSLFFLLASFSSGFFAAIQPWRPDSHCRLWTVDVEMCSLCLFELFFYQIGPSSVYPPTLSQHNWLAQTH